MFGSKAREVTVSIDKNLCTGCGKCVAICRRQALRLHYRDDTATAWVAFPDRCAGCGKCERKCSPQAISITEKSGVVRGIMEY